MIKHVNPLTLILCSTLLIACSDNSGDNEGKQSLDGTVLQGQIDALDKARGVEDTLLKANQQQRDAIDTQSR